MLPIEFSKSMLPKVPTTESKILKYLSEDYCDVPSQHTLSLIDYICVLDEQNNFRDFYFFKFGTFGSIDLEHSIGSIQHRDQNLN